MGARENWFKRIAAENGIKSLHMEYLATLDALEVDAAGERLLPELIRIFLEIAPSYFLEIKAAMSKGDREKLEKLMDDLRFGGGRLGALQLAQLCEEAVALCQGKTDFSQIRPAIREIIEEFVQVKRDLQILLSKVETQKLNKTNLPS